MCRMFGLASAQPVSARDLLHDAPHSLRTLSLEHHDGWGIATRTAGDWRVHRSTACAARCADFAAAATLAERLLRHQGAGHSVGLHTRDEKRAVAIAALGYIKDGDTIILDAGTSTLALAQLLTLPA